MKVQYCSDLHLEFAQNAKFLNDNPIKPVGDILVLAGDIIYWEQENFKHWFFDYVSDNFKEVYYIPGNHEFYSGKEVQILDSPVFEPLRENVFLVNNKVINIEGVDFFFTLFWSHIPVNEEMIIERKINDFYKIRHKGKKLRSPDFNRLHEESLNFLTQESKRSTADKKVVVTHHIPSQLCNPDQFRNSQINPAFVSEHYDFIADNDIDYWIYGHHHINMPETEINGTKLVTNQLGYVHMGEHSSFRDAAVFEI